ncbi:MAG: nucleotidyltransferase domain-containing protein [Patescibacteria group bacterium]
MSKQQIIYYQKEVERLAEKIKNNYQPEKIFIFGSFAYGKINSDSDVDFFIIKKTVKPRIERQREVARLLLDRCIAVDVLIFTPKEISKREEMGDSFIIDILKTGKLIYAK